MKVFYATEQYSLVEPVEFHEHYFDPRIIFPEKLRADVMVIDAYMIVNRKFKIITKKNLHIAEIFVKNVLSTLGYSRTEITSNKISFDDVNIRQMIFVIAVGTRWIKGVEIKHRFFVMIENEPLDLKETLRNMKEIES